MISDGAEKIKKIEISKNLEEQEQAAIEALDLNMFNENSTGTAKDLKAVLKGTTIKVEGDEEGKTLVEIATEFDTYVTKGEGRKLKLKDDSTNENNPTWIKNIIENPKNNDLAFFVQKIAGLIQYQTAKQYTEEEINAVAVSIDKTFGNQTKRALAGLKNWIENEGDYKTVDEGKKYEGKYLDKTFIDGVLSEQNTDGEKNTVLAKYNLQYKDGKIIPQSGYEFIDPYSNNLAVKEIENSSDSANSSGTSNEKMNDASLRKKEDIEKQLKESGLDTDNDLIVNIQNSKKYELDNFEYKGRFIIIKDGKISIYSDKKTYENMIIQEKALKRSELKKQKIKEIILDLENKAKSTRKDSNGNIVFEDLQGVSFENENQMNSFKTDMKKIIIRRGYSLENGDNPFGVSSKGNIYITTKNGKKFIEDNTVIGGEIDNMKNIEEFKENISNDEIQSIVSFLNKLNCWSAKEKFHDIEWPMGAK